MTKLTPAPKIVAQHRINGPAKGVKPKIGLIGRDNDNLGIAFEMYPDYLPYETPDISLNVYVVHIYHETAGKIHAATRVGYTREAAESYIQRFKKSVKADRFRGAFINLTVR